MENLQNAVIGDSFVKIVIGRSTNKMAVFRFVARGKIRAGDEEDARFFIREALMYYLGENDGPVEGEVMVGLDEVDGE
jgi:hypothetical protein